MREFGGVREGTVVFRSGERKKYVEEDKIADYEFTGGPMGQGAREMKAFKGEEAFTSAIVAVDRGPPGPRVLRRRARRGLDRLGGTRTRLRGREAATGAGQPDGRDVGVARKGRGPRRRRRHRRRGTPHRLLGPEAGAIARYMAAGGESSSCSIRSCPHPALRPRTSASVPAAVGKRDPARRRHRRGSGERPAARRARRPFSRIATGTHPIVRALAAEGLPVILPLARSVTKTESAASATMLVGDIRRGLGRDGPREPRRAR